MKDAVDVVAYFERIGYAGEREPTLDVLRAIHARHAESIAFENLNPLVGWPVTLDAASLERKIVQGGRGGYCYEHNLLFQHVLRALGFRVTGLAARVLWGLPADTVRPRTHMLLRVELDEGPYVADVGFGGMTLTAPLRLEAGVEQSTSHEPFRLTAAGQAFDMEARVRGEWRPLYRFGLEENLLPDYELASWYLSHHPASSFVTGLMAARPAPGLRYALHDNEFAVHHLGGPTERRVLTSAPELRAVLEGELGLTLPDAPELDAALERLATKRPERG